MPAGVRSGVHIVVSGRADGSLAVATRNARGQMESVEDAARRAGRTTVRAAQESGKAYSDQIPVISRFARQIRNVFAIALAFEFIRAFSAIEESLTKLIVLGFQYNQVLEQGRLAVAAILASTRQLEAANGELLPVLQAYPIFLQQAATLQREILLRSISTLGTAEELQGVFQRVLAFTAQQNASDEERLALSQGILNAGKLFGLTQEQLALEARQILTLESDRGQLILQSLGLRVRDLRVAKEQGELVQVLNKRLEAFNIIAGDVALSFQGLLSSVETMISLLSSATFLPIFSGVKDILIGIRDALVEIERTGGLQAALGVSESELRAFGEQLGMIIARTTAFLGTIIARFIEIGVSSETSLRIALQLFSLIGSGIRGAIDALESFADLIERIEDILQSVSTFFTSLSDDAENFIRIASSIPAQTAAYVQVGGFGVGPTAFSDAEGLVDSILSQIDRIQEELRNLPPTFESVRRDIIGVFSTIWNELSSPPPTFERTIQDIADTFSSVWDELSDPPPTFEQSLQSILGIFPVIISGVSSLREELETLPPTFEATKQDIIETTSSIFDSVESLIASIDEVSGLIQEDILSSVSDRVESLGRISSGIFSVEEALTDLFHSVSRILGAGAIGALIGGLFGLAAGPGGALAGVAVGGTIGSGLVVISTITDQINAIFLSLSGERDNVRFLVEDVELLVEHLNNISSIEPESPEILGELAEEVADVQKELESLRTVFTLLQRDGRILPDTIEQINTSFAAAKTLTDDLVTSLGDHIAEQARVSQAVQVANKNAEERIASLQRENAAIQEGIEQGLTRVEVNNLVFIAEQRALGVTEEKIVQLIEELELNRQASDVLKEITDRRRDNNREIDREQEALERAAQRAADELVFLQAQNSILQEGIDVGRDVIEVERQIAVAKLKSRGVSASLATQIVQERTVNKELTETLKQQNEAFLTLGDLRQNFEESIKGLLRGTLDLGDFLRRQGEGLGTKLFSGILFGKKSFDQALIGNINGLVGGSSGGIVGSIFGTGGGIASKAFTETFLLNIKGIPAAFQAGGVGSLFEQGGPIFNIFENAGGIAAGAFGFGAAEGLKSLIGFPSGTFSNIGGIGGGLLGGIVGTELLTPLLGPFAPLVGSFIGDFLFSAIGFGFDLLFAPGRIAVEKTKVKKFFENVFDVDFDIFSERNVAAGLVQFSDFSAGLQALGTSYAQAFGDDATQGTIIRFAGQFLANMQDMGKSTEEVRLAVLELAKSMEFTLGDSIASINAATGFYSKEQGNALLSLEEFAEEVEEARRNLQEYGDTTSLTAAELDALALANGNTGSTIVTYNELIGGAINLSTGFISAIDGVVVANKLLADQFLIVAEAAGSSGERIEGLADSIRSGDLSIEEAIIRLNAWRTELELGSLTLDDFVLNAEDVVSRVQMLVQQMEAFSNAVARSITQGIEQGLSAEEVITSIENTFQSALRGAVVERFVQDLLSDLLAGIDFTEPLELGSDLWEEIADQIGISYDNLVALLDEMGLLPELATDTAKAFDDTATTLAEIDTRLQSIIDRIQESRIGTATELERIGAGSPFDTLAARRDLIYPRVREATNLGRRDINLAGFPGTYTIDTELSEEEIQGALRAIRDAQRLVADVFLTFQAEVLRNLEEEQDAIRANFDLRREEIQDRIKSLQEEKELARDTARERIAALKEELAIAKDFARVAERLQSTIDSIVLNATAAFSGPEQLAFLQRRASDLRRQISTAAREDRPALIDNLAEILQSMLGTETFQQPDPRQVALSRDVLRELEDLRSEAAREGRAVRTIEEQILDIEKSLDATLLSIDARIETQQDRLERLSALETIALERAAERVATRIEVERERFAAEIQTSWDDRTGST